MDDPKFLSEADQSLWNKVLKLRPRLRRKITVVAQVFRGSRWYLLQDENTGKFIRVNSSAYALIGRLDGVHSVGEILESVSEATPGTLPIDPEQVLGLFAQLHEFEAFQEGFSISLREALQRFNNARKQQRHQRWGSLLSLRFSLLDPDRLLNALAPISRYAISPLGFMAWVLITLSALILLAVNYDSFAHAVKNQAFGTFDFVTYAVLYCAVKALHELGHGLAIKRWGGEVHDAGISLLVFMPVPYVDGSASLAFRDKRKRAIVSAAGIIVELLIVAIGVLVWAGTEPGFVNDLALKVTLICGLSTLLYNGNPLLRFDGYFVLEDLVEIPNLASRSAHYYRYLIQRYALGLHDSASPLLSAGERKWFLIYGLLSPLYRLLVLFGIAIFLIQKYFVAGVILASWAVYNQIFKPIIASTKYLVANFQLQFRRQRTAAVTVVPLALLIVILSVPMPLSTRTQGVVWVGDDAQVVAGVGGIIESVRVASGTEVKKGDVVLQLSNPALETDLQILQLKQSELRTTQALAKQSSRVEGEMALLDHDLVASQMSALQADQNALTVRSPATGVIVFSNPHELEGNYVGEGDLLAFVVQQHQSTIRTVINQSNVGKLSTGIQSAEVMLASQMGTVYTASIVRETPAGGYKLPSAALGRAFGGPIRTDLSDESGLTAESELFQLDLALPVETVTDGLGGRAFVKLYHGNESLLKQWSRKMRQLLLARLAV